MYIIPNISDKWCTLGKISGGSMSGFGRGGESVSNIDNKQK